MEYSPPGRGGPGPPYSNSQTYERKTIRSPTDSSDSRRQEMGVGDDSMSPSSPSPSMISSSSTQSNDPSHSTSASTDASSRAKQESRDNKLRRSDNDRNEARGQIEIRVGSGQNPPHLIQDAVSGSSVQNEADNIPPLLAGERVEGMYKDMTYLCPYSLPCAVKGSMVLTNYRIYFKSDEYDISTSSSGSPLQAPPLVLDVPLGFVSNVIKIGGQNRPGDEHAYGLEIVCKDIRTLKFAMSKKYHDGSLHGGNAKGTSRSDMYQTIRRFSFPNTNHIPMFAFEFNEDYPSASSKDVRGINGWKIYDAVQEFKRQGVPNESWRLTSINKNYELADTYPKILAVPKAISDDDLKEVAKFRSRARIPVLSWMHPDSQATITRCSQPLVGVSGKRSAADEKMVNQIMDANAESHRIFIMDARPKANAVANIVNGGGYEAESNYDNIDFFFCDIHNIHVMRESLRKVKEVCFPVIDDQKWLSNIDNTQWLNHLHQVLKGTVKIIDTIEKKKTSVIVHCSDGWDRTAQLTALSMMCLDPYYRTLVGFQLLIEKEWLSFGHKFADRVGHGDDKHNDNDRSPIFLQFIDCVWQVTNQFPACFEFNEYFLTFVLDHLYSCLFGTFLYNNDKERREKEVQSHTKSLWSFANHNRDLFLNPSYRGDVKRTQISGETLNNSQPSSGPGQIEPPTRCIIPQHSISYLKLWTGYYCRWNPRMRPQDSVALRHRSTQLLAIKGQLKQKVEALRKELETKRKSSSKGPNDMDDSAGDAGSRELGYGPSGYGGDRGSRGSAKFYADNNHHSYGEGASGNQDNYNQHSQHRNAHQSNYHQYHQPPPGNNQSSISRKNPKSNQPVPKISINSSNANQHQNNAHSSGSVGLVKNFESVNI